MLKVENLTVKYGGITAVDGISLNIQQGETVAMIGGAGKSTTLHAISGLQKISSGSIWFDGKDITKVQPHKIVEMGLVQVPEGRQIFTKLSVEENLRMGAYTMKDPQRQKENWERAMELFPGAGPPGGGHSVRRRTANAGHRPGADEFPQNAAAGRALHGPVSHYDPAGLQCASAA